MQLLTPILYQLVARALVVAGAAIALGATRAAGGGTVLTLEVGIIGLAVLAAISPDTHLGVLTLLLAGAHWAGTVGDAVSPWTMGFAAGIALTHTSLAFASMAPPGARWSAVPVRRWSRRLLMQIVVIVPTWATVAAIAEIDIGASALVMAGALLVVAAGGLWARHGTLQRNPPSREWGRTHPEIRS
ncbi:MAG: hypothetical protein GWO22_12215 [Actinobacteria bacterium]|nr:hypothetical protein [Actinomycetota bacterium]